MACCAPLGITSRCKSSGIPTTVIASATSTPAVLQVAARRYGIFFSNVISAAITAIHVMLMTPSANGPAISAQQQPRH
jgi:hypothetical protein